jgi:signal transduction histidine kinase
VDRIREWRAEILVALACGIWVVSFVGEPVRGLLVGAVAALTLLPFRRRPLLAGAGGVALHGVEWVAGVPVDNPASLAPLLVIAFALRRYDSGRGSLAVLVAVGATAVAREPEVASFLFVGLLVGGTAAFGEAVRRRDEEARRAAAVAQELQARDPAEIARRVVAEERSRLAGETLDVVRQAVGEMRRHAAAAAESLGIAELEAVGDVGRRAVAELRRLLGLLREVPDPQETQPPGTRSPARRWVDAGMAAVLATVAVLEAAALESAGVTVGSGALGLVLTGVVGACVALRRVDAALACLCAAIPPVVALTGGFPLPGNLATVVAWALLAWSAGVDGRRWALLALAVLAATTTADTYLHAPGNVAVTLLTFAVPAVAGWLWAARDRAGRAAEATATSLEAAQQATAGHAVQAERQRLARELHDVVSHAVSVMVLQAGAARALRDRDPARGRQAVRAVEDAGARALAELDVLVGLIDGGAVGPEGHALPARPPTMTRALGELAARIEGAGVTVALRVSEDLPADGAVAETVYRVAQEALTNAVRYAPGSRVQVTAGRVGERVTVTVTDDGARTPPVAAQSAGFGLVGLTERVRALGGELTAGPGPSAGFRVSATLPVPAPRVGSVS